MRESIAEGWTFAEARMGKDRQVRHPNIAAWQGGYSLSQCSGSVKVCLVAHSGSSTFHMTTYTFAEEEVAPSTGQDVYEIVDKIIEAWNKEQGGEALLQFKQGWMGEPDWQDRYPSIALWVGQGRRHCISIRINIVTRNSHAKAWLYDKPSNTETVLFEEASKNITKAELLEMLDAGIAKWLNSQTAQATPSP